MIAIPTHRSVANWLTLVGIDMFKINNDLTVDVDGDVELSKFNLIEIPVKFGRVSGSFCCNNNQLASFENFPDYIGGVLDFSYNLITNLEHLPDVGGGIGWVGNDLSPSDRQFLDNRIFKQCTPSVTVGYKYKATYGVGYVEVAPINPTIGMDLLKEEYMEAFVRGTVYDITFREFLNNKLLK